VPISVASLNQGDVFILDLGMKLFLVRGAMWWWWWWCVVWCGSLLNVAELMCPCKPSPNALRVFFVPQSVGVWVRIRAAGALHARACLFV
jgi:hypothetical protein